MTKVYLVEYMTLYCKLSIFPGHTATVFLDDISKKGC